MRLKGRKFFNGTLDNKVGLDLIVTILPIPVVGLVFFHAISHFLVTVVRVIAPMMYREDFVVFAMFHTTPFYQIVEESRVLVCKTLTAMPFVKVGLAVPLQVKNPLSSSYKIRTQG
jgi:hypothetical protein